MIRHRRSIVAVLATLVLIALAGCKFPGAGVSVSFTSPTPDEGARITSASHPATVMVSGKILGGTADSFTFMRNGRTVAAVTMTGSTFGGPVQLDDGANRLFATVTAAGFTYSATRDVYYPYLTLENRQAATIVMGQTGMQSRSPGTTSYLMDAPEGAGVLVGGHFYLADTANNRVVGYSAIPETNGNQFDYVLGHTDFTTQDAATIGPSALKTPGAVAEAGGSLVVADTGNDRVLLWNSAPTLPNASSAITVGQASAYSTPITPCDSSHLNEPAAAIVAGGKLIVADTGNSRVLIWNNVPTSPGVAADVIVGQTQAGVGYCDSNRGGTTAADTLASPSGVWSDGKRLVVGDTGNNRVLIWDTVPTTNGVGADHVVGQSDMNQSAAQLPAGTASVGTGLKAPAAVSSNGNQLFVADAGYHRVLIFNSFPDANAPAANVVLGQSTLAGSSPNAGGATDADTLDDPQGLRVFEAEQNQYLIVADTGNSRELLYRPTNSP